MKNFWKILALIITVATAAAALVLFIDNMNRKKLAAKDMEDDDYEDLLDEDDLDFLDSFDDDDTDDGE